MTPQVAYEWLLKHTKDTAYLFSTVELAAWDQRTYIPKNGHAHRSRQIESLARQIHQRSTDKRVGDCLQTIESSEFLNNSSVVIRTNVRMWRREYDKQVKIPESLASEMAKASSVGESVWETAVVKNDWNSFFPHLETLIQLNRQKAEFLGYENEPYDALLDEYEMGVTASFLTELFSELKTPLVSLLRKIAQSATQPKTNLLWGHFPISKQKDVCKKLIEAIGYSFDSGRLDETMHPFSVGIGPGDSRITTRYNESYLGSGLFGCLHEAGHSLYELGLPESHYGTPSGMFVSLGIHESQSRLWENMVGRSKGFWQFAKPILDARFDSISSAAVDELVLAANSVEPGLIRVEADEVTYNLHVLLRFELELALFRDELTAAELPEAWADKMEQYLGLRPFTAKEGVMQDVHWPAGMFGYFPTYTLGNIYAAQLFHGAQKELGDLESQFAMGQFAPLLTWLRENIHSKGQLRSPRELILDSTGELPTSKYFISHCNQKYAQLYNFDL